MRPWPALALLGLAVPSLAGADPSLATEPAPPAGAAQPAPRAVEVAGTVSALDLVRHRVTVDTGAGPVELGWDRNTLIYRPGGATTAGALQPEAAVKAGLDPAGTAYWIQVRPAEPRPASPPAPPPASPPGRGGPAT